MPSCERFRDTLTHKKYGTSSPRRWNCPGSNAMGGATVDAPLRHSAEPHRLTIRPSTGVRHAPVRIDIQPSESPGIQWPHVDHRRGAGWAANAEAARRGVSVDTLLDELADK